MIRIFFAIGLIWGFFTHGWGQVFVEDDNPPTHNNQSGMTVVLSMSGFGLGGFYRIAMPHFINVGANAEFFIMRGDREYQYIDPYYGFTYSFNRYSQLFFIPVNLEVKKRLFAHDIEDNFRPHLIFQAGAIFGINIPDKRYYEYFNLGDPKTEYGVTYNLVFGFGVEFISRENYFVSIRPQYRYAIFPQEIAFKKNHSAFEINIEFGVNLGDKLK